MGLLIALQPQVLPTLLVLTFLLAICMPMPKPAGHWTKRTAGGLGYGLLRALLAPILALGLLIVCQVTGAWLQGTANAAAARASTPTEQQMQRGPERGA